jgi:hypothetical protein
VNLIPFFPSLESLCRPYSQSALSRASHYIPAAATMPLILPRAYDEAVAKAAYIQKLADIASTQDLSEDLRGRTRTLTIFFTVLAAFFVGLRFTARWRQAVYFGIDDWLIVVALVLCIGNMIMNLERESTTSRPDRQHHRVLTNFLQ